MRAPLLALTVALALAPSLVACDRKGGDGSAPGAADQGAPELTAIRAGLWKDPGGGADLRLVETQLSGCFGFKGYAIKIPAGSTAKTLEGARACHITLSGAKKDDLHMAVFTDEVKVPFMSMTRDKLSNVQSKPFDEPDAFLYVVKGKLGASEIDGWFAKKLGPHNVRCNALMWKEGQELTFAFQRAVIELCRTLSYTTTPGAR